METIKDSPGVGVGFHFLGWSRPGEERVWRKLRIASGNLILSAWQGPAGQMILNWVVCSRDDPLLFVDLTLASSLCAEDSRGLWVANQENEKPDLKLSFNQEQN